MKPIKLATVALDAAAADSPTSWVQVTVEGEYKGYPGGGFKFTPDVLGQLVRNFRKHPAFVLGAQGEGIADVIPWDFNHASEAPATLGSLPSTGAPAQGWAQDLQLRIGRSGAELWAKTRWLEPARSYIKNGQYKWASVTVIFEARDPKSGANVGAVLTSIALTNTPFVEGMVPLVAASRTHAPSVPVIQVPVPRGLSLRDPRAQALLRAAAEKLTRPTLSPDECDTPAEPVSDEERRLLAATRTALGTPSPPTIVDATNETGRNGVERAIRAMRARSTHFAQLSWEDQVASASTAISLGFVRV